MDPRRALRRAITGQQSARIDRAGSRLGAIFGFPIAIGAELVLMHRVPEFVPDGFCALPLRDVTAVRSDERERFLEAVLRKERGLREIWPSHGRPTEAALPLGNWRDLLLVLAGREPLVIVECERRRTAYGFVLGRIEAVADAAVAIRAVNATGVWDADLTIVPLNEITQIRFGDRYSSVYVRHAQRPPE